MSSEGVGERSCNCRLLVTICSPSLLRTSKADCTIRSLEHREQPVQLRVSCSFFRHSYLSIYTNFRLAIMPLTIMSAKQKTTRDSSLEMCDGGCEVSFRNSKQQTAFTHVKALLPSAVMSILYISILLTAAACGVLFLHRPSDLQCSKQLSSYCMFSNDARVMQTNN